MRLFTASSSWGKSSRIKSLKIGLLILVYSLKRKWKILAVILTSLVLTLFAQYKFQIFSTQPVLSQGLVGTYQEHDLPPEVTKLLSSSLVEFDQQGRPVAKLASSWEVNKEATVFKFTLGDDLRWVDGSAVKSFDLELALPNVEVSFPNEKVVELRLKESYSPLPSLLTKPVFKKGTLMGTGPYKISKIEKSRIFITKIVLEPTDGELPKLIARFYPNEKTAAVGFQLGEVQALLGTSNFQPKNNNPQADFKQVTDLTKIVTVLYNTKDPLLGNRSVRQALSYIVPEPEHEEVASNPLPKFSWAYDPNSKKYMNDTKEAKEALGRAKASLSNDAFKKELILTSTPYLEEIGKVVVSAWKSLGFDAKLRIESGIPQNFQALLITQSIPVDPDQYFLWHSTQEKTNFTKYSFARVDKDLEDARKIVDEGERKSKYLDFQKALLEDAPALFLYYPKYNVYYLKKAKSTLEQVLPFQLPINYK